MDQTVCSRLTYGALLLFLAVPMAFAANPANRGFIGGHVGDGLYFESKMNFVEAIREYNQAVDEDGQDRFAWVCLAKAYRARDLYGNLLFRLYNLYDRHAVENRRCEQKRPIIRCLRSYLKEERARAKFGHYGSRKEEVAGLLTEPFSERLLWKYLAFYEADTQIQSTVSSCAILKCAWDALDEQKKEKPARVIDDRWKRIEEDPNSPQAWLDLAIVSKSELAAAAFHVVLFSDPNPKQSARANEGIDHPAQRDDDYQEEIPPDLRPLY